METNHSIQNIKEYLQKNFKTGGDCLGYIYVIIKRLYIKYSVYYMYNSLVGIFLVKFPIENQIMWVHAVRILLVQTIP